MTVIAELTHSIAMRGKEGSYLEKGVIEGWNRPMCLSCGIPRDTGVLIYSEGVS